MNSQPAWINKELYPFNSNWIDIEGHTLHYLDEGDGRVILFVHGTPEWSFGFRDLIRELRNDFRCIAIDHLGFGLSDKPSDADYACEAHGKRLTAVIERLGLQKINLVANDFGGSIGMSYAISHSHNIDKVILFNTWMWSLKNNKHYNGPARLVDSWLGKFLYLTMNFPVNAIMPASYFNKKKLTGEVHRHYKEPMNKAANRVGQYAIARQLMNASDWWESLWARMTSVQDKQFLIFWGMKDKFVPTYELKKWQDRLPQAQVIRFDDAGHFVQEEKPDEMILAIRTFLS